MQRFKALELAVDQRDWTLACHLKLGAAADGLASLAEKEEAGAPSDSSAHIERSCEAKGRHEESPGWGSGRWVTEPSRPETTLCCGTSGAASHREFREGQETRSCWASSSWWPSQRKDCRREAKRPQPSPLNTSNRRPFTTLDLRPHSLRRGGVTHDYLPHVNLPKTTLRGRCSELPSVRIYINDGLSMQAQVHFGSVGARGGT